MAVLGNDCFVLRERGLFVDVIAFAPEYATLKKAPVVDGAILYTIVRLTANSGSWYSRMPWMSQRRHTISFLRL
jgi:hypothetical protein